MNITSLQIVGDKVPRHICPNTTNTVIFQKVNKNSVCKLCRKIVTGIEYVYAKRACSFWRLSCYLPIKLVAVIYRNIVFRCIFSNIKIVCMTIYPSGYYPSVLVSQTLAVYAYRECSQLQTLLVHFFPGSNRQNRLSMSIQKCQDLI